MSRRFRSFQRGTVDLGRSTGCKVTICESWRMILSSRNRTRAALVWFEVGRAAGFFSDLQLWQHVTLQPADLQRPTIHFWNPWSTLINPVWVLLMMFEILFKIASALCVRISTPAAKKIHSFASVWYEIGVIWANITHIESHATALDFCLQTDMNQIFEMMYCMSL